jgi:hypothetical protein
VLPNILRATQILGIWEPTGGHPLASHDRVLGRHAANQVTPLLGAPRDGKLARKLRADEFHERRFGHRQHVFELHPDALARPFAACLLAGLTGPDDYDAVAKRTAEAAGQRVAEAVPIGEQHHHRDDAP